MSSGHTTVSTMAVASTVTFKQGKQEKTMKILGEEYRLL
jgi:hypothetical protein